MLGSALLLMAQAASPSSALPNEVRVIGRRAEQQLAACITRNCPPAEEVEASLQASVAQFTDGRYEDARHTLQRAIRRNRDYAVELPGPVSSLYATLATVAEHEGDEKLWLASARNNVLVLRRHLGKTNLATLREELSFADNMVGLGMPDAADRAYQALGRNAAASGYPHIAVGATFRRAWLAMMRDQFGDASRLADTAVGMAVTDRRWLTEMREILLARIAVRKGDEGAVDALAARLRRSTDQRPTLIFAPPVDDINHGSKVPGEVNVQTNPWHDSEIRFADVGYWIRPDGRTSEAEVLRDSGLGQWAPGIIRQVSRRRYVPTDAEPGHPGIYRIDRFTVRATIGVPTSSRIARRMGDMAVHVVDLTEAEAMSAARRQQINGGRLEKDG